MLKRNAMINPSSRDYIIVINAKIKFNHQTLSLAHVVYHFFHIFVCVKVISLVVFYCYFHTVSGRCGALFLIFFLLRWLGVHLLVFVSRRFQFGKLLLKLFVYLKNILKFVYRVFIKFLTLLVHKFFSTHPVYSYDSYLFKTFQRRTSIFLSGSSAFLLLFRFDFQFLYPRFHLSQNLVLLHVEMGVYHIFKTRTGI